MIYVVLGMHKSGTTLVSQILHHSGIPMDDIIESTVSYDKGNQYERQSVLALDMDLLQGHMDTNFFYKTLDKMDPDGSFRHRVGNIIKEAESIGGDWGFKDPRLALTYPLWRPFLPKHKIIFIFRAPGEIWPRYRYLKPWYFFYNFKLCREHLERWYVYNASIYNTLMENGNEYLVLNYKDLMTTNSEFKRMEKFSGRALEDRRRPELYRNKSQESIHLRYAENKLKEKYGTTAQDFMDQLLFFREQCLGRETL